MEWLHPTVRTIYFAVLLISAGALAVQSLGRTLHGRLACALVGCVAFAILAGHEGILDLLGRGAWPVVAKV